MQMTRGVHPRLITTSLEATQILLGIHLGSLPGHLDPEIHELTSLFGAYHRPVIVYHGGKETNRLLGPEAHRVTHLQPTLQFYEDLEGYSYLIFSRWLTRPLNKANCDYLLGISAEEKDLSIVTAWSPTSAFGIRIKNNPPKFGVNILRQIYEAYLAKDLCILTDQTPNTEGAGLEFLIYSRIPKDIAEAMRNRDRAILEERAKELFGI